MPSSIQSVVPLVAKHIVPLMIDALDACVDRHQQTLGVGSDNYSFGTDAWSFPKRLIADAASAAEIPFKVEPGSGFAFSHGSFVLHHHRVGDHEAQDISCSFPATANRLQDSYNTAQLNLFAEPRLPLALAYMANPDTGLAAVYLCSIGEIAKGSIIAWEESVLVWTASADVVLPELPNSEDAQLPPPEKVQKSNIVFFPQKSSEGQSSDGE